MCNTYLDTVKNKKKKSCTRAVYCLCFNCGGSFVSVYNYGCTVRLRKKYFKKPLA